MGDIMFNKLASSVVDGGFDFLVGSSQRLSNVYLLFLYQAHSIKESIRLVGSESG